MKSIKQKDIKNIKKLITYPNILTNQNKIIINLLFKNLKVMKSQIKFF